MATGNGARMKQIGFYIVSVQFVLSPEFHLGVGRFCSREKRCDDENNRVS
jgi:hypothetical protein